MKLAKKEKIVNEANQNYAEKVNKAAREYAYELREKGVDLYKVSHFSRVRLKNTGTKLGVTCETDCFPEIKHIKKDEKPTT